MHSGKCLTFIFRVIVILTLLVAAGGLALAILQIVR